jgi:hypothetical protein
MKLHSDIVWQATAEKDWREIDRQWRASKRAILAFHGGCWQKGESPSDALARALNVACDEALLAPAIDPAEAVELALLYKCLRMGWEELQGLNIEQSIDLVISIANEKLAVVPPEVRAFFGAPVKLESVMALGSR